MGAAFAVVAGMASLVGGGSAGAVIGEQGCDFNGDAIDDIAITAPYQSAGVPQSAGAVHVHYGSDGGDGVGLEDSQYLTQDTPGIPGSAEAGDGINLVVTCGDFDGDNYTDLAMGFPHEDIGSRTDAGGVVVVYGSSDGLDPDRSSFFSQNPAGVAGAAEARDYFGRALTSGDYDGDGRDDLAVGVPYETFGSTRQAGVVQVLYGSGSGLTGAGSQVINQSTAGIAGAPEENDFFGSHLESGTLDGDAYDDLVVGVDDEDIGSVSDGGAVTVVYGSSAGVTGARSTSFSQNTPGVPGAAENFDGFGRSLVAGDFDGDGIDELAVGVPTEGIGSIDNTGIVMVFDATAAGVTTSGVKTFHQGTPGIPGTVEQLDQFGFALSSGDYDGNGEEDLAIGHGTEAIGAIGGAGAVTVLYGDVGVGLSTAGAQSWHQDVPGVPGAAQGSAWFGRSVGTGDFNFDFRDDLAVGLPGRGNMSTLGGAVVVLYGAFDGLNPTGAQFIAQTRLLPNTEAGADFGFDLSS